MSMDEKLQIHIDANQKQEAKPLTVNPAKIGYEVDPIQDERIRDRMSRNPEYARVMSVNKSALFYKWIKKKIDLKENIIIEITNQIKRFICVEKRLYSFG